MKRKTVVEVVVASLAVLVIWKKQHQPKPVYDLNNVVTCARCKKIIGARYPLKLVRHLIDDHKLDEDTALDTMIRCCKRVIREH